MAPVMMMMMMIFLVLLVSPDDLNVIISLSSNVVAAEAGEYRLTSWVGGSPAAVRSSSCIGEYCNASITTYGGDVEEAEDFISRRILQQGGGGGYISYDALKRNTVPCSMRGASYYNCQPGAEANPYNRGCSAITRCRS